VEQMTAGSVIADVAIDQGGCFETSRPTNFKDPIYVEHGIIHQCITNLPSAVPRTSAFALNHVTLPYILELASKGYKKACLENPGLLAGLNLCSGVVTHESVAQAIGAEYTPAIDVLQA
jgi:alanine dehydrogenase